MNLQELIDFHTVGAEACEAYAVTPGAAEDKNKDIGKHYNKRAKWHRDAIALVQGLLGQGEPVALLSKGFTTLESEGGKYRIITAYQNRDDAWSDYRALCKAEQPAPVADHTQCEECKGWGYHENHHEGGGTECGECGGSGNATVAVVIPDHTMRSVMDAIQQARGFPVLTSNQCHALAESLNYVARLNGVKP